MRVYDALDVEVLRSTSTDWRAPVIRTVDFEEGATAGSLRALLALDTTADLERIVVLRFLNGTVTSEEFPRAALAVDGNRVEVGLSNLADGESFVFQVVDTAGNATTFTAKSTLPSWIEVDATVPAFYVPGQPVTLTATVPRYDLLEEDVWWSWDFGARVTVDGGAVGTRLGGKVPRPPAGATASTVSVTAVYGADAPDPVAVAVRVHDSDGGIGIDRAAIRRACDPPDPGIDPNADLVGCDVAVSATAATFGVTVTGVIAPGIQYRVGFDTDGNGGVDKKVTYKGGSISGLKSATAGLSGPSTLVVTVPLADVAYACPVAGNPGRRCVAWQIETQDGVQATQGAGFVDAMRDTLTVTVV
jgi:hypothetical protein